MNAPADGAEEPVLDVARHVAPPPADRGERWALIATLAEAFWGPLTPGHQTADGELDDAEGRLGVRLPTALREGYRLLGAHPNVSAQDVLLPPLQLAIEDRLLRFRVENQGCADWACTTGEDDDPAVSMRTAGSAWRRDAGTVSAFFLHIVMSEILTTAPFGDNGPLDTIRREALASSLQPLSLEPFLFWPEPDEEPRRFFGGRGVLAADDAGTWVWVAALSAGQLDAVRKEVPSMPSRHPALTRLAAAVMLVHERQTGEGGSQRSFRATGVVVLTMPAPVDLQPAALRLAHLVEGVPDDALARPTPCSEYTVGDLLDHLASFLLAFTAAAAKAPLGRAPKADAANLTDDWRARIPEGALSLAEAWRAPDAWTGMTAAGGIDLPADVAGIVGLDELVIHGWDLARATDQPSGYDGPGLPDVHANVLHFRSAGIEGLFGPEVPIPEDAPLFDRILGATGRNPAWTPPG